MKALNLINFILIPIIAAALSGIGINKSNQTRPDSIFPSPLDLSTTIKKSDHSNSAGTENLENSGWFFSAIENIQKDEYNITFDEKINSYQSPNRANNIRYIYHNDGYTARNRDDSDNDWEINLRITNLKSQMPNVKTEVHYEKCFNGKILNVSKNTAYIEDENIRINYSNDKKGMRQDFIIKNKPEGNGRLRLNLEAETKLRMNVGADALTFKDKNGNIRMNYSALKCWDVNGKELRAYFEKFENKDFGFEKPNDSKIFNTKSQLNKNINSFSIIVDDEDAEYPITIDPLSTSPNWTATCNQSGSQLGYSVATAGDVNGDGYSDVIIGAPQWDYVLQNSGKVFLYYGSANGLSNTPNWTADLEVANSKFGSAVSTAGDVNGDGYSDIIIGAPNSDIPGGGNAFVWFGSRIGLGANGTFDNVDWYASAYTLQHSSSFGYSVSTAGDVNGDGYSDIIIGAPTFDNPQAGDGEGAVFVWMGSSSGLGLTGYPLNADWTVKEDDDEDTGLGESVSTAGDVNGDGYSDIIIGKINTPSVTGDAFVWLGSSIGLGANGVPSDADWMAGSNQYGMKLGSSVSTAGDVNGDGYSDIIIGAPGFINPENYEGGAFVWYGSSSGLGANGTVSNADWMAESNQQYALFGTSVSTAGDVNGDGFADVIIGAPHFTNGEYQEGCSFVYFGSQFGLKPNGTSQNSVWKSEGNEASSEYGFAVSLAGDVNGDGFSDLIIGAKYYDDGELYEGKAFAFYGSSEGPSTSSDWRDESNQSNSKFGYSVNSAGDVNGDGYSDVIISAPYYDNGQTDEGRVYVYHGSDSGISATPNFTIEKDQPNARFGISVSTAGDINGDGYSDVIIGSDLYNNGQAGEGGIFVYKGSSSGLISSGVWMAESNQDNANLGISVATAGDVNGDGYSDIIAGANKFDNVESDEGKVFVWFGSISGLGSNGNPGNADWSAEINQAQANFGCSVSSAGDINGDGFTDIIIGADKFDNGQTEEGKVFAYFGSSIGISPLPIWTSESNNASANFGSSVSCAGDVNGDGYSDIIVGAVNYSNGESGEGSAFVYLGSNNGLSGSTNWSKEGNQVDSKFGNSVANAGDVNGDGYSDVIVGAYYFDNGQSNEGKTFIYYGSSAGLSNTENWVHESDQANSNFGSSVSPAGDVNGDGFSDVIIGADLFDNGQSNEGNAFVYYGNNGGGYKSYTRQYRVSTLNVISSGGLSGVNGAIKVHLFAKSPFGKTLGKIVYECKPNGIPFSGSVITNSTSYSGMGSSFYSSINGVDLISDITSLPTNREYKWRARVMYKVTRNPYQVYGPWKYYTNYIPAPYGCFKAQNTPLTSQNKILYFFGLIQGFYNPSTNNQISDTITVYLRNSFSPYAIVDSAKEKLASAAGVFQFNNAFSNINYFLQIKHRNSIETWSQSPGQMFGANTMSYNFSTSSSLAYGSNLVQVDDNPVRFAFYSGDVNKDGYINLTDVIIINNDATNFVTGYRVTDITGDNITDLNDVAIAFNNSSNFVRSIKP